MPSRAERLRVIALLAIAVIAAYANSLSGEFLAWDDESLVLENPYLRQGTLAEIGTFFASPPRLAAEPAPSSTLDAIKQALARRYELGGEYLPVRDLSWWIDARIFRRAPEPDDRGAPPYWAAGFHLGNLLLHLITTVLVWCYARQLGMSSWAAAVAGLLFALHPVHTESVAWIASRKDVLSAVFFVGTLLAHAAWRRTTIGTPRFLITALPLTLLAVMSKSTVMSMPLVFLLVDAVWFAPQLKARLVATLCAYAPFFMVSAGFSWIVMQTSLSTGLRGHGWHGGSFAANLVLAAEAELDYLRLLVVPASLRNAYENPEALRWSPSTMAAAVVIPVLVLTFLVACARRVARPRASVTTSTWVVFALGWFFITLLPVANVLVPMNWLRAERSRYLPSIGFCLLLATVLDRLRPRAPRGTVTMLVALIALAYGARTIVRNRDWHDTETVWQVTLAQDPHSDRARIELAACDLAARNPERTQHAIDELRLLTTAHPELPRAHYLLGLALVSTGRHEEGIAAMERAIAREADPTWIANLSHAWLLKAQDQADHADHAGAARSLEQARATALRRGLRTPDDAGRLATILFNLAVAHRRLGSSKDAERDLDQLLALPGVAAELRVQAENLRRKVRGG
ncbi:MAG: hypothetical protein U1E76_14705 [Planctomycetota bacterium]